MIIYVMDILFRHLQEYFIFSVVTDLLLFEEGIIAFCNSIDGLFEMPFI